MNHNRQHLLTIGAFANVSQLSLKALRLYDQLDIMKPAYIDPQSGYRYYHSDQLYIARLVRMMRQMDMPLATIRAVLTASQTEAIILVQQHWIELQRRLEQARPMVQDLIAALKGESATMSFDVQVKTVESQSIVSITEHVKVDKLNAFIQRSLDTLYAHMQTKNANVAGAPFGIYHGSIDEQSDGPIEVCLPTEMSLESSENVKARELPGGKIAWVTLVGDECHFPQVLKGYDTIIDWINQNGYQPESAPREIWHTLPGDDMKMGIEWPFREW